MQEANTVYCCLKKSGVIYLQINEFFYYNAMIKQSILYGSGMGSTSVDNLQATEACRTRYSQC